MSTDLTDASEARKLRLLALRQRKVERDGDDDAVNRPFIRPRNFDPETRTLRRHTEADTTDTVENAVDGLAEMIIAEDAEKRKQELDIFNIAPKRPNWDLKREMERKLSKLERKTQQAILVLIRQRLAAQKGADDDLVGAMNAQQKADEQSDDEE